MVARAGDGAMAALEALLRYLSATHEKVPQDEIVRALGEALDSEKQDHDGPPHRPRKTNRPKARAPLDEAALLRGAGRQD